jgi:formylglycine-generating enzyme required for sulfatase activity
LSRFYFIEALSGERRLEEQDFPLSVGGAGTDVVMAGVDDNCVIAHIALSDGHAYIQPAGKTPELFHNHEHIISSAWLKSGDRIQIADQELNWVVKGDRVLISIRPVSKEPELQAPHDPPPGSGSEADTGVVPLPRSSLSAIGNRRLRYLVIALFSLLLLMAAFVLFATPVMVSFDPEPESWSLDGFPPPVPLGGRLLVVPGGYTVKASLEGYQPLELDIDIPSGDLQALNFDLMELPGRLKLLLEPAVTARLIADDIEIPINSENIALLDGGLRALRIETDRYLPEERELAINGRDVLQELHIKLQPAWADVELDSLPTGATVELDGKVIGTTPLVSEILQGQRQLDLSLSGYKTFHLDVSIEAGSQVQMEPVSLEPNDGKLVLDSSPTGATVSIDGKFHGSTPLTVALSSGVTHKLRLSEPGYLTMEQSIKLQADETRQLGITLPPEYGIIFVTSKPADAKLMINGEPAGTGTQRLRLTTRSHRLSFSKPGHVTQSLNVTPQTGTSQNIDITLKTLEQAKAEARPEKFNTAAGQEMYLLEPGAPFQMGASRREAGRRANESQRLVEITKPFYLSATEVSNAAYRKFNPGHNSGSAEGVSLNGDKLPVVNVSWNDAARFCNWLSKQENLPLAYEAIDGQMVLSSTPTSGYRLPTEAEWVYAARIHEQNPAARYPWKGSYPPATATGNYADAQIADTLANVVSGYNDGYRGPAPVGSFTAQTPGFHDLGGNVAEWINDYYAVYPGAANRLVKDPRGPVNGDHHVVRGSSWRDGSITELRLSYRDYSRGPRDNLGFRIARYADE